MNEKALTQEFRRVGDGAPVPADLFPEGLLLKRAPRRPRWLAAVAAAAMLLVFLATPVGWRTVRAAGDLFYTLKVKVVKTETPAISLPVTDISALEPGQVVIHQQPGYYKVVARRITLADLPQGMPLPTYRGPGADALVVREETYRKGEGTEPDIGYQIRWTDGGKQLHYSFQTRTDPFTPAGMKRGAGSDTPTLTIYTNAPSGAESREVQVKGQPAVATQFGKTWSLFWWHEYGGGSLSGEVALEELLKIAESLPSLK